jgi:hypothetical protein
MDNTCREAGEVRLDVLFNVMEALQKHPKTDTREFFEPAGVE